MPPQRHEHVAHSGPYRFLTDEQVRVERAELARDMLFLLAQDAKALPKPLQKALRHLHGQLLDVWKQLRSLP
jgi:hypothetical protein